MSYCSNNILNNRSEEYKLADSAMEVEDNKENVDQKDEDIIGEFICLLLVEVAIKNIRILKTAAITHNTKHNKRSGGRLVM